MLKEILVAFLMKEKIVDELFEGGNAPLGTFSSRAKLAYTLALISEPEFHDIDLIRRIRNEFAHDTKASFANDGVKSRCGQLKHQVPDDKGKVAAEGQFTSAATGLLLSLVNRAEYVSEKRRSFGNWKR